jgi:predicted nucleic acid-binding protein
LIAAADASVLLHMLDAAVPAPNDPATGSPVVDCKQRIDHLIATLAKKHGRLVIPTPALSEVLVRAGAAGPEWLRLLGQNRSIRIVPFDTRAAVECAAMAAERLSKNSGAKPRWKAKFDEQIVAIANVEGATAIYSDDDDISRLAREGVEVIGIAALPLPPQDAQGNFLDQIQPDEDPAFGA